MICALLCLFLCPLSLGLLILLLSCSPCIPHARVSTPLHAKPSAPTQKYKNLHRFTKYFKFILNVAFSSWTLAAQSTESRSSHRLEWEAASSSRWRRAGTKASPAVRGHSPGCSPPCERGWEGSACIRPPCRPEKDTATVKTPAAEERGRREALTASVTL